MAINDSGNFYWPTPIVIFYWFNFSRSCLANYGQYDSCNLLLQFAVLAVWLLPRAKL